jgi:ABC-2 type transport system ATP-binding protein
MAVAAAHEVDGSCVLATSGLAKAYGRRSAVADLDLSVARGEVVGFLGPNGAGKSTTLRVLIGALRPTRGSARVLGLDPWHDAAALHRRVGYVPGDLRLPLRLTGRELLRLYDGIRGGSGTLRDSLVERLGAQLDQPVRALSRGNRQKLGIVQAFMSRPELLLLDEPTSGLDPLAQEVFEELVAEAVADGAAVLLSSHVLSEVEQVADRVAMLDRGRLVAVERLVDLRREAPHRVEVQTPDPAGLARVLALPGVSDLRPGRGRLQLTATRASLQSVIGVLGGVPIQDVSIQPADLEGLFLQHYQGGRHVP